MRQRLSATGKDCQPLPKVGNIEPFMSDIQSLLKDKVFLGYYSEKRYVESLQAYRDVIAIDEDEEIHKNLFLTKKKLETVVSSQWVGITKDPQNTESEKCLLWVLLDDVPVGKHWFQICAIRFEAKEVILEVKHVQQYRSTDKSLSSDDPTFPSISFNEVFTYENICEAAKFIAVLMMVLFTFMVESLRYLGEFSIKFSYVLVSFMQASTPIFLGFMDFLSKCVGGLYWLIYVLIRQPPNAPPVPSSLLGNTKKPSLYKPINYRQGYSFSQQDSHNKWGAYQRPSGY